MIGIVGGGITGLVLSHHLARAGVEHLVFEAAARPGGVIRTLRQNGHLLEFGPQRTRLTPGILELVAALGLRDEVLVAPAGLPLFVYRAGRLRLAPLTFRDALRTDLIGWRAKARILLEPFTRAEREDETVAAFLTRKLGVQAYEYLVGPLYGGLYASDPQNMLMRQSLSRALRELGVSRSLLLALLRRAIQGGEIPPACSFREGMASLPLALHERNESSIRLNAAVTGLRPAGDGFELIAGDTARRVTQVVLTVPADVAADLLQGFEADTADRLRSLNYNPLAVVHMYSEYPLHGMGFQVPYREELLTRGVTWNNCLFDRPGIYTAYLGGARHPGVLDKPDAWLAEAACTEFQQVTGGHAEPLHVSRIRMPAWDRSWQALEGIRLPPRIHICANYESRAGLPGRIARARALAESFAARI